MKNESFSQTPDPMGNEVIKHNKIIHGPILKTLTYLSLPIMFAMFLQMIYSLTDMFWVGRLGVNAVASITLSWPILFLITSFGNGLAIAGTILVSQYKGKGDENQVNFISSQTFSLMCFMALIFGVIGYFNSNFLISLMGASPDVVLDAVKYLQVSFIGLIFTYVYFSFQSLMRGVGEVKIPLYIVFGTVILNFILDPIFILGYKLVPQFGVSGAAWTTIIAQAISSIIGLGILIKGNKGIKLHLKDLKPNFKLFKKMFNLGFPSAIGQSVRSINMLVITFLVTGFGTVSVAAFGIGIRILALVIVPAVGFSMALSTMIGQNMGAKKIDRAGKISNKGMLISFLLLTLIGVLFFLFGKYLIVLFIPGETEVILECTYFIKVMALTFGFVGIQMAIMGIFNGSGNTRKSMYISIISLVFLLIFAIFLSRFTTMGVNGIWWAYPLSNISTALVAWILVSNGKWKDTKTI